MAHPLYNTCHTYFTGHKRQTAAEVMLQMSEWCAAHNVDIDDYGQGDYIQQFEQKIADLLGFEAAVFMITGTMAQSTALQLACEARRNDIVAMHSTCHVYCYERQGYQIYNRFKILPLGDAHRPWDLKDLKSWPDEISAVIYELPMRTIGGQLPTWDELQAIKAHCATEDIHCHLDGARLWECAAYYGKSYGEIAAGFNSAYVSLYKGIGGLGGSILAGDKQFIEKATMDMKRQGGNVYHRLPYVVSAAMNFDRQIAAMPSYFERTQQIYRLLAEFDGIKLNPAEPQVNMLHVYLPVSLDDAQNARNQIAKSQGVWLFGGAQNTALANECKFEWYIGENLLNISDSEFMRLFGLFYQQLNRG